MDSFFPKGSHKGFTLVEILLVIAILAILATITIVAINPLRHLAKSRDAERSADVYSIVSAIHQYAVNHDGSFPVGITNEELEICRTESINCTNLYDLAVLTENREYLISIPNDPKCDTDGLFCSNNGSGYFLKKTDAGKISVRAGYPEVERLISVTR